MPDIRDVCVRRSGGAVGMHFNRQTTRVLVPLVPPRHVQGDQSPVLVHPSPGKLQHLARRLPRGPRMPSHWRPLVCVCRHVRTRFHRTHPRAQCRVPCGREQMRCHSCHDRPTPVQRRAARPPANKGQDGVIVYANTRANHYPRLRPSWRMS